MNPVEEIKWVGKMERGCRLVVRAQFLFAIMPDSLIAGAHLIHVFDDYRPIECFG